MAENSNLISWVVLIALGAGVVAASVMASLKKKNPLSCLLNEEIDASKIQRVKDVKFDDITGWYKTHNLVQGIDIPFLAKGDVLPVNKNIQINENEKCVCLGIYNEKLDEITDLQIIIAEAFEQKILDLLKNEQLVVLK